MKGEYFDDGGMLLEADNMTPSDAVFVPRALQGKTPPTLCEFPGCTEMTIFGMCSPHAKEMDRRQIEELVKQGWKISGTADEPSGQPLTRPQRHKRLL